MKSKPLLILPLMGGVFMFVSGFPHAMAGSGEMTDRLLNAELDSAFIGGIVAGWHFGSLAMFTLGAIVVVTCIRLLKGIATPVFPALLAGAMYVVFGVWGMMSRGVILHFFGFISLGLMVLSLIFWQRAQRA